MQDNPTIKQPTEEGLYYFYGYFDFQAKIKNVIEQFLVKVSIDENQKLVYRIIDSCPGLMTEPTGVWLKIPEKEIKKLLDNYRKENWNYE